MRLDEQIKYIQNESKFTKENAEWMRRHFKAAIERAEALEDLAKSLENVLLPKQRGKPFEEKP